MKAQFLLIVFLAFALSSTCVVTAQGGGQVLFGDLDVDESKVTGLKPLSFDLILYTEGGMQVARQTVSNKGRYRFNNLGTGVFEVVVEVEGKEVARVKADLTSPLIRDLRQDISLEWRATGETRPKAGVVSAGDHYERGSATSALFEQARQALDQKKYNQAAEFLESIIRIDPNDFQAWTELANVHFLQKSFAKAENEYLHAIDLHSGFFPGLLNLGRLEIAQQKYDVAIEVLARALKVRAESADVNYFLGESYLQLKKGSLAVGYLKEALRLDPQGMAEVHLRLALLYHGAGMKDKAAAEYEEFLRKKPDYPERKKLEKYIAENKKH